MMRRLLPMLLLLLCGGCSSGQIGPHVFTYDGRYLLWGDSNHVIRRTECSTGRAIELARGRFIPDRSRTYLLCFQDENDRLVRIADEKGVKLTAWPEGTWPGLSGARDLLVESYDPPHLRCLSFNAPDGFAFCEYRDGAWRVLNSRCADKQACTQLRAQCKPQWDQSFIEPGTGLRKTPSPDGQYVLVERGEMMNAYVELREAKGDRCIRLATQTDQFWQALGSGLLSIRYSLEDSGKTNSTPRCACTTQNACRAPSAQPSPQVSASPTSASAEPGEPASQSVQQSPAISQPRKLDASGLGKSAKSDGTGTVTSSQ